MSDYTLKILAVCGSGVVSSSMVVTRIKEILADNGIKKIQTFELTPAMLKSHLERDAADLVISTTRIEEDLGIPIINAVALLSGIGEDKFIEEFVSAAKQILKQKGE